MRLLAIPLGVSLLLSCSSPSEGEGTLVVLGARVFTVDDGRPWASALVVDEGRLVYVGDDAGAEGYIDRADRVLRLEGELILPGLHDVHQHTLEAHLPVIDCILDPEEWDPEAYVAVVAGCDLAPGTDWVLGWGHSVLTLLEADRAPRLILDDAVSDHPVAIMEETSHSTWVNTRALELLGLDASTPDPQGGLIIPGDDGSPNGILVDAAGELPWDLALQPNPELDAMNIEALRAGLAANNEVGITSAVDARTYWQRGYLDAYTAVEAGQGLTVRMVLSLWASSVADDDTQIAQLADRFSDPGGFVRARQVKLYSDGLIENTTAALLAPYATSETWGSPLGLNYFPAERLTRYVTELQAAGFDAHIHTIGDRAVREGLDAVEASPGGRHRLTHVELLNPDDLPRFAALGVAADLQIGAYTMPSEVHYLDELVGADRIDEEAWRLRDLWESGAVVALSSDYDVNALSPFEGMERALTRGDQSLPDVAAAIRAYTLHAAWIMRSEDETGSLEEGKWADFVVVDQDLFEIAPEALSETRVLRTFVAGEEVYAR